MYQRVICWLLVSYVSANMKVVKTPALLPVELPVPAETSDQFKDLSDQFKDLSDQFEDTSARCIGPIPEWKADKFYLVSVTGNGIGSLYFHGGRGGRIRGAHADSPYIGCNPVGIKQYKFDYAQIKKDKKKASAVCSQPDLLKKYGTEISDVNTLNLASESNANPANERLVECQKVGEVWKYYHISRGVPMKFKMDKDCADKLNAIESATTGFGPNMRWQPKRRKPDKRTDAEKKVDCDKVKAQNEAWQKKFPFKADSASLCNHWNKAPQTCR